jgi:hypothetical protein
MANYMTIHRPAYAGWPEEDKEAVVARYRVKINGFRVVKETPDDVLQRDGKYNEVQISVITIVLDGDGKLVGAPSEKTTPIMGDTNQLANRVKAGSASSLGGLMTGDSFPDEPMPWLPATPTSPQRDFPPYVIWEGELPDDGSQSVVLTPTILEYDDGQDFWTLASGVLKQIDDTFGQKAKAAFGTLWPVAAPVFDAVSVGIQTAAALPRFLGNPGTRPIGMTAAPGDPSKYVYAPKMLGLNAKTAAEIVGTKYLPGRPGVFSTAYQDASGLGDGRYELYIQVEDISHPPPAWSHVGTAPRVRALSMWASSLLAVTDDARLWYRSWVEADLPWTPLGSAPLPAGLAVDNLVIYCAGRDNGLYAKPEPFMTPWQRIGHANDVRGLAAAAGRLYCATRDNSLWMRDGVLQDVPWQRIGHANQVVSMTAMGSDLVCATRDNQIWTRPATPHDVDWTVMGTAPALVSGLAFQQNDNSLWVTTIDNRLWKFRF